MRKVLLALSLMVLLAHPAAAQESQSPASSCAASDSGAVDYVQRGDNIILMECPAMEGGAAACTCHEPPGQDGQCPVYACNADGSPKAAEVKPAPPLQEEKPVAMAKPTAAAPVKSHSPKKKAKTLLKQSETPSPPAPAPEEKKTDVLPVQAAPPVAPAPASDKIEYSR